MDLGRFCILKPSLLIKINLAAVGRLPVGCPSQPDCTDFGKDSKRGISLRLIDGLFTMKTVFVL